MSRGETRRFLASNERASRNRNPRLDRSLDHGRSALLCGGRLQLRGTVGALVGPPWSKRENGFLLSENVEGGLRMYYEPHCDFEVESVSQLGQVDVVVSPIKTVALGVDGLGYPLGKFRSKTSQGIGVNVSACLRGGGTGEALLRPQ